MWKSEPNSTHDLCEDLLDEVNILQVVEVAGSWRACQQTQLCHVGGIIGRASDAHREELHPLVFGISRGREDVRIAGVRHSIGQQHCHLDGGRPRLSLVHLGHVGDGVGGVGAMADVDDGKDPGPEVLEAAPLFEGLLNEHVTAVLQQCHLPAQATARPELDAW